VNVFRLVIFDYDGTLFDTRPAIVHCLRRAFEECGRPAPAPDAAAGAVGTGASLPDTLLLLDRRLRSDLRSRDELVAVYRKLYGSEGQALLRAIPGVPEVLHALHDGGVKCVVVSSKGTDAIHRSLDESGLRPLVDMIVGDAPGLPKKPDPSIVTDFILPRYDQHGEDEMLMVGDTEIDILFAKRAGISCCWASYGYGDPRRCRTLAPRFQIAEIGELRDIVFGGASPTPRV
jgi:phosphoglycolate phosphatase